MNKCCPICDKEMSLSFTKKVLGKYNVSYFYCKNCHMLQTEKPYWLTEAYSESITEGDTGYVGRNLLMARISLVMFFFLFKKKSSFLDYAGGYGLFARLMYDYGFNFYWQDEYTDGIFVRGLEYSGQKIDAVTCFECFEHFENPSLALEKINHISKTILLSTKLIPENSIPDTETWGYYGFDHGQHITLYSEKSLQNLAKKHNLNFYTDGKNIHLITDKKINILGFKILLLLPKYKIDQILQYFVR